MLVTVFGAVVLTLSPVAPSQAGMAEVEAALNARVVEFFERYAAGDAEGVAAIFAADGILMPPGTPAVVGRDAIREHVAGGLALGSWDQRTSSDAITLRGDTAIERGHYTIVFRPHPDTPDGRQPFRFVGKYVVHWTNIDGSWFIATYIGNNDGPQERLAEERVAGRRTVRARVQPRPGAPAEEIDMRVHESPVDPPSVAATAANLADDELVLGVVVDDQPMAYPIRYLAPYEVLNDLVGSTALAPTW